MHRTRGASPVRFVRWPGCCEADRKTAFAPIRKKPGCAFVWPASAELTLAVRGGHGLARDVGSAGGQAQLMHAFIAFGMGRAGN